jgi:hypothetical protein
MLEFLAAESNLPFSVALAIMFALALLEGVGMLLGAGISSLVEGVLPDLDIDVDAPDVDSPGLISHLLGWLYVGKVPFLVVFIVLLTCFGITGLLLQSLVHGLTNQLLPGWLATIPALVLALPFTRLSAGLVAKVMPRDETEAVSSDSFIGRVATIVTGTARAGYPAQARLNDQHGQTHYIMVEPDQGQPEQKQGEQVLLVRRQGNTFISILNTHSTLVD